MFPVLNGCLPPHFLHNLQRNVQNWVLLCGVGDKESLMKQIRLLAQYYVDLMMKLGLVRFSMLLALALVVLAIVVQMAVTMVLHGQVESIDVSRSICCGPLITTWAG